MKHRGQEIQLYLGSEGPVDEWGQVSTLDISPSINFGFDTIITVGEIPPLVSSLNGRKKTLPPKDYLYGETPKNRICGCFLSRDESGNEPRVNFYRSAR